MDKTNWKEKASQVKEKCHAQISRIIQMCKENKKTVIIIVAFLAVIIAAFSVITITENIVQEAHSLYGDEAENMIPGMLEHMANEMEQVEVPMYVLTNKKRYYGAACIVYPNVLEEIGDLLQEDYYIIPSSVHEILFLPASKCIDSEALNSIIEDVNRSQVEDEDWLSDHTYLYQREQKRLLSIPTTP